MQRPTVNLSQCQRPQRCGRLGGPRPSLGRLRNPALRAASASTPIHGAPCRANEPPHVALICRDPERDTTTVSRRIGSSAGVMSSEPAEKA
jgi:hypothetical protein